MNINIFCEFESIEFAELAIGELKNYKSNISRVTLTARKNNTETNLYTPLAAAGADVYNGPGGPTTENFSLTATSMLPAFSIGAFNDTEHTEPQEDRTCRVKITCDMSVKKKISDKMISMGAHNIRYTY